MSTNLQLSQAINNLPDISQELEAFIDMSTKVAFTIAQMKGRPPDFVVVMDHDDIILDTTEEKRDLLLADYNIKLTTENTFMGEV